MRSLVHLHLIMACGLVSGASAAAAQQSVTLTSTADFQKGNNEGLISTAQNRVARDRITAGTVGAWSATTAIPSERADLASVAHNGFVYAIGGRDIDYIPSSNVWVAAVNANGSLGAWASTSALPSGRHALSSAVFDGFVYAIGGINGNDDLLTDVLVAPINADGTIGGWSSTTALPVGEYFHSSFAYNGFLYVTGGFDVNFAAIGDVLVAPINADGSVGAWSSTTSLPSGRGFHSTLAYNGFLYTVGGGPGLGELSGDVLVASINADGTIGSWLSTTSLPLARGLHSCIAHNGFLYSIGGLADPDIILTDVVAASINPDGSVGSWSSTSSLPSGRGYHASAAYGGFMWAIGGFDSGFTPISSVVVATIDADAANANQAPNRLRGFYSHLVDLQSDPSNLFIVLNGQVSPGGVVRLQVRVAPDATGVFGSETLVDPAPLGSVIQILGTGRFVWIRLTLDDTATSDADQATYVSDITISPGSPPTAGVVNDGSGADIDSQSSTTTIEANWSGFTASGGDGIAFYEWAIGTAPGQTNIQDWVNVGLATSASNSSLSLGSGIKYVRVRAISASGLPSPIATSDGVEIVPIASAPAGGSTKKNRHCGHAATASPSSLAALLAGLVILASAFRRRMKGRLLS